MEQTIRTILERLATVEANVKILMIVNLSGVGMILTYAGKTLLSKVFNGKKNGNR